MTPAAYFNTFSTLMQDQLHLGSGRRVGTLNYFPAPLLLLSTSLRPHHSPKESLTHTATIYFNSNINYPSVYFRIQPPFSINPVCQSPPPTFPPVPNTNMPYSTPKSLPPVTPNLSRYYPTNHYTPTFLYARYSQPHLLSSF